MGAPGSNLLGGRYALGEKIGAGGFGEVWRATDLILSRTVVLTGVSGPRRHGPQGDGAYHGGGGQQGGGDQRGASSHGRAQGQPVKDPAGGSRSTRAPWPMLVPLAAFPGQTAPTTRLA